MGPATVTLSPTRCPGALLTTLYNFLKKSLLHRWSECVGVKGMWVWRDIRIRSWSTLNQVPFKKWKSLTESILKVLITRKKNGFSLILYLYEIMGVHWTYWGNCFMTYIKSNLYAVHLNLHGAVYQSYLNKTRRTKEGKGNGVLWDSICLVWPFNILGGGGVTVCSGLNASPCPSNHWVERLPLLGWFLKRLLLG